MFFNDSDLDERHQDPKNWKWGIFYYNPKDERLWLPKRIPALGITLNFAKPAAYFILIPLISIPIILALFVKA